MRRIIFVLFITTATATAQPVPRVPDEKLKAGWEQRFRNADKNNDRTLDRPEAEAGLPKVLSRNFDTIDVNADRRITPEELWAMHQREVAAREKRRAERVSGPPR